MSENYDHPPASSRRPSLPSDQSSPAVVAERRGYYQQRLYDLINADPSLEHVARDLEARRVEEARNLQRQPSDEYESDLDTILSDAQFANPTSRLLDRLIDEESRETPRDNQSSARPRERLIYLRNLIHQESNHTNTDDTTLLSPAHRAIEVTDAVRSDQTYEIHFPHRHSCLNPRAAANVNAGKKRRKLDADDNREDSRGFNYGHQGQVVPGALKMEIVSCDGGVFNQEGDSFFPGNVLRNDQTVYSTKSDRCNLILRHRDEAPFCLKKIVIKAPRTGFDSPIQEGMVFVSMTSDELLARTAQYQIQYSSTRRRRGYRRMDLPPSQAYLTGLRTPLQSLDRTVLMGPDSNLATETEPSGRGTHDPLAEFRVTTEYNETVEDNVFVEREDDNLIASVTADLERTNELDDLLCSDTDDDSPSDDDDEDHPMTRRRLEIQRRIGSARRSMNGDLSQRRRQPPSLIDPIPPPPVPGPAMTTSNGEVLKPHARFFIEREKSVVSIKFDPPPSGRFILIKLWSPRSDGNIDIQSIIAHGYAGPRFFPAGGFR
ncbi:hypothetical protein N7494_005640 [Penicillium frequentans]|uniref:Uncharacterized protein n=1 Tax=Penicillium frequentans TaxID=3151616 RepID=A0AAD6CUT1_9EURO|nr:hypothetical protein N7494_005640 [Penicillium glabrum]